MRFCAEGVQEVVLEPVRQEAMGLEAKAALEARPRPC